MKKRLYIYTAFIVFFSHVNSYFNESLLLFLISSVSLLLVCFLVIGRTITHIIEKHDNLVAESLKENAKRKEEFFTNASHELKTPLCAIKGFNELTALQNKDEALNKFINGITRETNRMMDLILDMLNLSEIENTTEIVKSPVYISPIVKEVRNAIAPEIEKKSINFIFKGNARVTCNKKHLYEIVKNLVENAVRYTNENGKVIVKVERIEAKAKLIVKDNGIGISLNEHSKIFERFYRVEKSRQTELGGTGLGLSIVKHICALYNWELVLKSELGIGTEITIYF